jgi:hypothetical protein
MPVRLTIAGTDMHWIGRSLVLDAARIAKWAMSFGCCRQHRRPESDADCRTSILAINICRIMHLSPAVRVS